jgi:hypothetical protein
MISSVNDSGIFGNKRKTSSPTASAIATGGTLEYTIEESGQRFRVHMFKSTANLIFHRLPRLGTVSVSASHFTFNRCSVMMLVRPSSTT